MARVDAEEIFARYRISADFTQHSEERKKGTKIVPHIVQILSRSKIRWRLHKVSALRESKWRRATWTINRKFSLTRPAKIFVLSGLFGSFCSRLRTEEELFLSLVSFSVGFVQGPNQVAFTSSPSPPPPPPSFYGRQTATTTKGRRPSEKRKRPL